MHKIINGLRYGNRKTKGIISSVIGLFLFGTISLVLAFATLLPLWGMSSIFSYILAVIVMQSVSFAKTGEILPKQKKAKSKTDEIKEPDETMQDNEEQKTEKDEEKDEEEDESAVLDQYQEKDVKRLLVKYKVRKDHRPVMIDSCQSKQIRQCPAYAWMEKNELALLLFEKEPRLVTFPTSKLAHLTYEPHVLAFPRTDYEQFQKPSFLNLVFSSYLPTVYEDNTAARKLYRKNLYVLGEDLKFTNRSAKVIMELTQLDVCMDEKIRNQRVTNPYVEKAYELNILLKDGVLTVTEFKHQIREVLNDLSHANISEADFSMYLRQMLSGRMITSEYAQYYMDYRKKYHTKD